MEEVNEMLNLKPIRSAIAFLNLLNHIRDLRTNKLSGHISDSFHRRCWNKFSM